MNKNYFWRSPRFFAAAAAILTFVSITSAQNPRPTPRPMRTGDQTQNKAGKPDAQMQAVLDSLMLLKPIPIETLTPGEARYQPSFADAVKNLRQKRGEYPPKPEAVGSIVDTTISTPAGALPVRIYTPAGTGPFPVIVYYHGGGWVIASVNTYDASARALTNGAGAIVMAVEYRKGPENKFPAAHDDAFAAYQYAVANAASFGGDAKRIAVAGESAGGNLACNVSIMARDKNVQMPVAQLLVYPVANNDLNSPSMLEVQDPKLPLNRAKIQWFVSFYLTTIEESNNPMIALVKANLANLPPTTIVAAQIDPLRSEGQLLAERLRAAGVAVDYKLFDGVTHEFFGMGAVLDKAKQAETQSAANLRRAFGK